MGKVFVYDHAKCNGCRMKQESRAQSKHDQNAGFSPLQCRLCQNENIVGARCDGKNQACNKISAQNVQRNHVEFENGLPERKEYPIGAPIKIVLGLHHPLAYWK